MPDYQLAIVPVTVFQQNCTVLWNTATRRCIIVDPGGEPGRILDVLVQNELRAETILLTHGHIDHAGGALATKGTIDLDYTGRGWDTVPILGPDERDRFLLDGIEEQAAQMGFHGLRNVTPDRFLTEGEKIETIGLTFEVLHCPGHSPGHIVFVEKTLRLAFVGDVIMRGTVGRTDFAYGDGAALIAAIKDKLLPLGDDISFICGHGEGSTFGVERQRNPFLQG
ncbi:MAG: MBL fold metallo-hydrolase [Acetobacteraceae bacterium]|nr:MBL fold metallo-hydrolase [Acetobacteraceae bacterium]